MDKRELTCIGCPMGCFLTVMLENGEAVSVEGNTCQKGDIYARKEVVNPTRIVTSTVKLEGSDRSRVSVKTSTDIPKSKIFDVMKEINEAIAKAPVSIGDVIIKNVAGTGSDIIATGNGDLI
ncbi:MAG: DUF1667 domain-containing protein [Butyrivibrio sp.]|nr:DUF1667 domain-containing protein [Butyrivibrio sp.]